MTFIQGMTQLATTAWNEIGGISIPFIGITIGQMTIGIFCVIIGVAIIKRLFQGTAQLTEDKQNQDTGRWYLHTKYGQTERVHKNKMADKEFTKNHVINAKRWHDEL